MKLLGRDFDPKQLLAEIEARLALRGLSLPASSPPSGAGPEQSPEQSIDPLSFNLQELEEHSDPTRPLPLHTHRQGLGRAVLLLKWGFRKSCQVFINQAFARQRLFNEATRQSYAELAAEVLRLRGQLDQLSGRLKNSKRRPRADGQD